MPFAFATSRPLHDNIIMARIPVQFAFIALLSLTTIVGCRPRLAEGPVGAPTNKTGRSANASVDGRLVISQIVAEGRIEPAAGVVGVYATPGDRLIRYTNNLIEGQQVTTGAELGELLSSRVRQGELNSLKAKLAEAKSMRVAENAAKDADVAAADRTIDQVADGKERLPLKEKEIALLTSTWEQAKRECKKLARLRAQSDLVSASEFEKVKLAVEQAKTAVEVAESEFSSLELQADSQLAVAKAKRDSIAASHDRALAMIPLDSLDEQRKLLEDQWNQSRLPAPISGTILKINTRPGEAVVNQPLLLIADLSKIVCVTEVYETYVNRLKVGQAATIRSTTFGDKNRLKGKVASIGRIIMTPDLKPLDPFAKADVRVVEVRIEIDPGEDTEIASRLINLQVDVEVLTDE